MDSEECVRPLSFGKSLALILGAGLLLRWFYLADVLSKPELGQYWFLDSREYLVLGSRIVVDQLDNQIFSSSPLYIWLVGHLAAGEANDVSLLLVLQQLMGIATAGCVAMIGRQLFNSLAGLIGAALYLLYGAGAMLEVKVMPAIPATFFATLAALLFVLPIAANQPARRMLLRALGGLTLGLATLCKADLLLIVPFAAAGAWWFDASSRRSNLITVTAFVIAFATTVSLATLHNYRAGELVLISSQGGQTFYHGNNPRAEGTYSTPEGFTGEKATQGSEAKIIAERALGRTMSVRELDSYWYGRGIAYLRSEPMHALWLWGRKLLYWMSSNEVSTEYTLQVERQLTWRVWLFPVPFGLLLVLSALGLLTRSTPLDARVAIVLAPVAMNLIVTLLFYCASRYRLPAIPLLAVLAGSSVSSIWEKHQQLEQPYLRLLGLLTIVGVTFLPGGSAVAFQAAGQWYLCGNEAFLQRDFERAVSYYERALEVRRRTPDIYFNLGHAYAQLGDYARAAKAMNQVTDINPRDQAARKFAVQYSGRIAGQR